MKDRPVRLLMIAGSLSAGGAEKQAAYHARALAAEGIDLLVVSLDGPSAYGPLLSELGVPVISVADVPGRVRRLARIVSIARGFAPDFVQATHTFANLYAWAAARACGALSIGALRVDLRTSQQSNGRLAHWHLSSCDAVIANSRRAESELGAIRPRGVHFLENALDLAALDAAMQPREALRRIAGAGPDDVLVLGLGTVRADKAFDRFLRVMDAARARCPRLKGVIVGDGPELARMDALRRAAPRLASGVVLAGRQANGSSLMRGADIFFMSSDNEGAPNALMEAMAAGLPSVVTPAGDAGRFVEASRSGVMHAFDDEAGMAAELVRLAESPGKRAAMGARARHYAETEFDFPLLWPRMLRAYTDIAVSCRRTRLAGRLEAEA